MVGKIARQYVLKITKRFKLTMRKYKTGDVPLIVFSKTSVTFRLAKKYFYLEQF